jgi:hypothetical protein
MGARKKQIPLSFRPSGIGLLTRLGGLDQSGGKTRPALIPAQTGTPFVMNVNTADGRPSAPLVSLNEPSGLSAFSAAAAAKSQSRVRSVVVCGSVTNPRREWNCLLASCLRASNLAI